MLGVIIGVASVIVMVSVAAAPASHRARIRALGTNLLIISPTVHLLRPARR
jgi:hypothetical protein